MTLSTHAVVGAAIVCIIPEHPILGFSLAFASHFLLDAIPHWDYKLKSMVEDHDNRLNNDMIINKDFFIDLARIFIDALLGLVLVTIFFIMNGPHLFWLPIVGVVGALLPDALQFIYFKWKHQPLVGLQRFHLWIHSQTDFNDRPLVGIAFQVVIIIVALVVFRFGLRSW